MPEGNLRSDALFLTFCASYNGKISRSIRSFCKNKISIDTGLNRNLLRFKSFHDENIYGLTNKLIESGNQQMILTWLKEVGLVYNSIRLPKGEENLPADAVYFTKNVYDRNGKVTGQTEMDLRNDESEGTRKFYAYIGRLYRKFQEGGLYICDGMDCNFLPSLLQKIIQLFQNPKINKANAQLLFTSHDTNLMDPKIMRRDQFYFAEKSIYDSTKLYSLSDMKGINNNTDFARQYLAGIYGSLPILSDYLEKNLPGEN